MRRYTLGQHFPKDEAMPLRWRAVALSSSWLFVTLMPLQGVHMLLPAIADKFNVSAGTAAWVAAVYTLANAGGFVAASHAGDLIGHKRVAITGSYLEVITLMLIVFSPTLALIIAFRFVQGIAHAMAVPNLSAYVVSNFPQEQRGRALGINSFPVGIGMIFIAALVGAISDAWGWRAAFLVPAVAVLLITVMMNLSLRDPDEKPRRRPKFEEFDLPGAVLLMGALVPLLVGVQMAVQRQWGIWPYALMVFAVALAAYLVRFEYRREHAALPVRLFKSARFAVPNVYNVLFNFANSVGLYMLPVFFIQGLGWTAAYAGFVIIAFNVGRPVASLLSGFLADKIGPQPIMMTGAAVLVMSLVGVAFTVPTGSLMAMVPFMVFYGFGQNLFGTANQKAMYSVVPQDQLAMAPGTLGLGRHMSNTAGVGVAAGIFGGFIAGAGVGGEADAAAMGFRIAMFSTAAFVIAGMTLAWVIPALWRMRRTEEAMAESGPAPPIGG